MRFGSLMLALVAAWFAPAIGVGRAAAQESRDDCVCGAWAESPGPEFVVRIGGMVTEGGYTAAFAFSSDGGLFESPDPASRLVPRGHVPSSRGGWCIAGGGPECTPVAPPPEEQRLASWSPASPPAWSHVAARSAHAPARVGWPRAACDEGPSGVRRDLHRPPR